MPDSVPTEPTGHEQPLLPLVAATQWLSSSAPRKVLVLSGPLGSGRRDLLEQAVQHAADSGTPVQLLSLSLEGFEPLSAGLAGFVNFRLAFGRPYTAAHLQQLERLLQLVAKDPSAATHGAWAVGLALLFALENPDAVLSQLVAAYAGDVAFTPEALLASVLTDVIARGPCVVFVSHSSTLSDATLSWFLSTVFSHWAAVSLAFSCAPQLSTDALILGADSVASVSRIELTPRAEQQSPAHERLSTWFASLGADEPVLRRVLGWAAVCGERVPILPLLAAAQVPQEDVERLIDRLDEEVCGDAAVLPLLDDYAYRHPGFPELSVYHFRDRGLRRALLARTDAEAQRVEESELFAFLGKRLNVATRSIGQLFVNLSERVRFELSTVVRQRLRLWVGPAEQAGLTALLREAVSSGRLPAEALLRTGMQDATLAPFARLALVDAAVPDDAALPHEQRMVLIGVRTELLVATRHVDQAVASAQRGLTLLDTAQGQTEPAGIRGLLFFMRANAQRQQGNFEAAGESFRLAAEQAAKPRPDGSIDLHNRGICLAEAGHCSAQRGQWSDALALLRESVDVLRQAALPPGVPQRARDEQIAQLERDVTLCETKLQETVTRSAADQH